MKITQEKLINMQKIVDFCQQPRLRKEVAEHLGVSEPTVSAYVKILKPLGNIRIDLKYQKHESGNWMCAIVTINPELSIKAVISTSRDARKHAPIINKPQDAGIASWLGYTDFIPPLIGDIYDETTEHKPSPQSRSNQRVWVSGSTLSSIYMGA